jgi:hypothetical protein
MFLSAFGALFFNCFKVFVEFLGDVRIAKDNYTSKPYEIAIRKCVGKVKKPARELRYAAYATNRAITKPRHWRNKLPD